MVWTSPDRGTMEWDGTLKVLKKMDSDGGSVQATPTANKDIVNKEYVDDNYLKNDGDTGTGTYTFSMTDDTADAFSIQEGANHYMCCNTTNGSENIVFGCGAVSTVLTIEAAEVTLGVALDMGTHKITGVVDPTADQEAATKKYVDDNDSDTTDHTALSNIGTNTHTVIDTHLASTTNPHSTPVVDTLSKHLTIEDPTATEDFSWVYFPAAVTITALEAVLVGSSTPSVTINPKHHTDRSNAGNGLLSAATAITDTTTGTSVSLAGGDVTIPASSFLWLETTAQSGTVDELYFTLTYTED